MNAAVRRPRFWFKRIRDATVSQKNSALRQNPERRSGVCLRLEHARVDGKLSNDRARHQAL